MGAVVHLKKDAFDVCIDRSSMWGNPFVLGRDGDRDEVIRKYEDWILTSPDLTARLIRESVHMLKDCTLGCWCAPERCHGDILAWYSRFSPDEMRYISCLSIAYKQQYAIYQSLLTEPQDPAMIANESWRWHSINMPTYTLSANLEVVHATTQEPCKFVGRWNPEGTVLLCINCFEDGT